MQVDIMAYSVKGTVFRIVSYRIVSYRIVMYRIVVYRISQV